MAAEAALDTEVAAEEGAAKAAPEVEAMGEAVKAPAEEEVVTARAVVETAQEGPGA